MSLMLRLLLSLAGAALCSLAAGQDSTTASQEFAPLLHNDDIAVLKPGAVINSSNLDQFTRWLDESVIARIRADEYQITLGEKLNIPSHPRYVEATENHIGKTLLSSESGELENYQGGRPFPALDIKDVNLHPRLAHSKIELHPTYDPRNARTIQYISRS